MPRRAEHATEQPLDTEEDVHRKLGDVLVESVNLGRRNRKRLRWLTWPLLFDILLTVLILAGELAYKHNQRVQCDRFNESRAGELALWQPLLASPRAPLKANASAEEKRAYDDATIAREQFERNLHLYFDPIKF